MERKIQKRKTKTGHQEVCREDKDVITGGVCEAINSNEGEKKGSDLKRLLEDLQLSRKCIEEDQRAYQKAIRDIQDVDKIIATLQKESLEFDEKKVELCKAIAAKSTELKCAEFLYKVANDAKKAIQQELMSALEDLHNARMEVNTLSNAFLSGVLQFGTLCNGTKEGFKNRVQAEFNEKERLEHEKIQLETELEDFLTLQKGLKESEEQLQELEIQYKELDEEYNGKEKELEDRFNELDFELAELKRQEESDIREFQEESDTLKDRIEKLENEITWIESQSSNAKQTVLCQKENSKEDTDTQTILDQTADDVEVDCITLDCDTPNKTERVQKPENKRITQVARSSNNLKVPSQFSRNVKGTFKCPLLNSNSDDMFSDICEDEMLLAAADEVSQNIRTYQPMAPSRTFSQRHPSAPSQESTQANNRCVNGQVPISNFMRQLSTPMKRTKNSKTTVPPSRGKNTPTLTQMSSTPRDSTGPGKVFNFKKKKSAISVEVENLSMDFNSSASSARLLLNESEARR